MNIFVKHLIFNIQAQSVDALMFFFLFVEQDRLLMPFPSIMALQPVTPGSSSAPDSFPQTAALHQPGALPHRTVLHAAYCYEDTHQLDWRRKPFPPVLFSQNWNLCGFHRVSVYMILNISLSKGTWRELLTWTRRIQAILT